MNELWLAIFVVQWLLLALLSVLMLGVLRALGAIEARQNRIMRPAAFWVGDRIPELRGTDLDGRTFAIHDMSARSTSLIVFVTTTCGVCHDAAHQLQAVASDNQSSRRLRFVLVIASALADATSFAASVLDSHPSELLIGIDPDRRLTTTLQLAAAPAAFLVGPDGVILQAQLPATAEWVKNVVAGRTQERANAPFARLDRV